MTSNKKVFILSNKQKLDKTVGTTMMNKRNDKKEREKKNMRYQFDPLLITHIKSL